MGAHRSPSSRRLVALAGLLAIFAAANAACGSSPKEVSTSAERATVDTEVSSTTISPTTISPTTISPTTIVPATISPTTMPATVTTLATVATVTAPVTSTGGIVNTWIAAKVDPAKLPLGDPFVTRNGAKVGTLWACRAGNPNAPGAHAAGPWLNLDAGTWDSTTKIKVNGAVTWPSAAFAETVDGSRRVLTSNSLPVGTPTGIFPIASSDPASAYDRNPGRITETARTITLPSPGTIASAPSCMGEGPVAMLNNGVFLFNALDARGQDAVAHESQDVCDGHPAMTTYHYHSVPSCIRDAAAGPSTVVGWAWDGFPIVVERDAAGNLPTNADLDECHGRTSPVPLDGAVVTTYHYSVTLEFPYTLGCFRGTAANVGR